MNRNFTILFCIYLFFVVPAFSQSSGGIGGPAAPSMVFSESNLPIVVINTNGQTIVDDPKKIVNMSIINNAPGVRNHLSDPANEYNGKIAIEIRGSSSQSFPKKSYGFETRDNSGNNKLDVSIFGMNPEHDWILSANYTDKTFCRNVLAYQLSREMGHYAAKTKYVELVLNGTHMGIYVFMEKIKRDPGRVDVSSLHPNEITPPDITGGYIIKVDKTTGSGGTGWTSAYPPINHTNNQKTFIQYDYPSSDSLATSQKAYIRSYVDSFENALAGSNFRDTINGYPKFIGNASWIDYFFNNELSKNVDGYRISSYLYKDKNKQLKAGPVWDYDIAWGNANYCSGSDTTGWAYLFPCTGDGYQIPFWWQKLQQDSNYTNEMKCRWTNFRQSVLSESHIFSIIDSISSLLSESKNWNFTKWPILGTYVWPNPSPQPASYAGEIQNLKNWVHRRLLWMDGNMPGQCSCSLSASVVNVSCNGVCDGKAMALGVSSYKKSYVWSNGLETDTLPAICAGSYSLTMTDKIGCTRNTSVVVTQPAILAASSNHQNTNCAGNGCSGSASIIVSGGTTPYSYSWSNGQSNAGINSLCQATYVVTVSDYHGCTKSSSVTILNPNAPVVSLSNVSAASCQGASDGSASVTVSGGTGPYTYSWSPNGGNTSSASGLHAGLYTAAVIDAAGCSTNISVTITEPLPPILSTVVTNAVCRGLNGSAAVIVNGGAAPYSYSWSTGRNSASLDSVSPGQYSITVTDHSGCTAASNVTITEPDSFSFVTSSVSPVCFGGNNGSAQVNAAGGTGMLTYSWASSASTSSIAANLPAGNYSVTVTDASGCTAENSVTITDPPEISLSTSSTTATCGLNDGTASVNVINGNQPYNFNWTPSGSVNAAAANLNSGDHVVTVVDANGCTASDTVEVQSASGLNISVTGQTEVSCSGGSDAAVSLNVTGGASPYQYSWAGGSSASNLSAGVYSVSITESNGCMTEYQFSITEPQPLSVNVNSIPALCYGSSTGSITANTSGGSAPYNYFWPIAGSSNQSLVNISAGQYSVVVTDAHGCTKAASSLVNQPLPMSINMAAVDARCGQENGSAQAFAVGGSGTYNYSWSTGDTTAIVNNLASGIYFVTAIDSNNCSNIASILVGGTAKPVISIGSLNDVTCSGGNNGSAVVSINGGTGTLAYQWTPSVSNNSTANNLTSGIYSVVVSDDYNCSDSIGFIVSQPAPMAALIFSENVNCFGSDNGILFADVGGGTAPYSFLWSNGQMNDSAVNLTPGTYSVQITDVNNCTSAASGTITEPADISINFSVLNATCQSCTDGTLSAAVSGGVPPLSYNWQPGNQSTPSITNLAAGTYSLCITDASNCSKCSNVVVVNSVIGVEEIKRNNGVYVYPNPMNESAIFAFTLNAKQSVDINIFSVSGQLVKKFMHEELESGEHLLNFDASDLAPGIYFYQFKISSHFQTGALVVNR